MACRLIIPTGGRIVLLKLMPVQHPRLLGSGFENLAVSEADQAALHDYLAAAKSQGVFATVLLFQYVEQFAAIEQAAWQEAATVVIASLPVIRVPIVRRWQLARLRRKLARSDCILLDHI